MRRSSTRTTTSPDGGGSRWPTSSVSQRGKSKFGSKTGKNLIFLNFFPFIHLPVKSRPVAMFCPQLSICTYISLFLSKSYREANQNLVPKQVKILFFLHFFPFIHLPVKSRPFAMFCPQLSICTYISLFLSKSYREAIQNLVPKQIKIIFFSQLFPFYTSTD